jgi:hypothetical protein
MWRPGSGNLRLHGRLGIRGTQDLRRIGGLLNLALINRTVENAVELAPLTRFNDRGRIRVHGGAGEKNKWLLVGRAG